MPHRVTIPASLQTDAGVAILAEWYQPTGAIVGRGDRLLRIEVGDMQFDLAADVDGMLRQAMPEGSEIDPGLLVAVILEEYEVSTASSPASEPPDPRPRTSTAFDMAAIPDFSGDDIFTASGSKEVLGRRILPRLRNNNFSRHRRTAADASTGDDDDALAATGTENAAVSGGDHDEGPRPTPIDPFARSAPRASARVEEAEAPRRVSLGFAREVTGEAARRGMRSILFGRRSHDHDDPEAEPVAAPHEATNDPGSTTDELEHDVIDMADDPDPAGFETEPVTWQLAHEPDPEADDSGSATAVPDYDPRAWLIDDEDEEPYLRARRPELSRPAPAAIVTPSVAANGYLAMHTTVHLAESIKVLGHLTEDWSLDGLQPDLVDLAVRAAVRAARLIGDCHTGSHPVELISFTNNYPASLVLCGAADATFRELVQARISGEPAWDPPCFSVVAMFDTVVESFIPRIRPGEPIAVGFGSLCEIPSAVNGQAVEPVMTVTLVYDGAAVEEHRAVQMLGRIRGLIEGPAALIAN